MAKKLGDDKAATGKDVHGNLSDETFLQACAEIAAENAKTQMANEARKAVRKKWKANGVELGDLDAMLRMAEWDRSEVRAHFQRRMAYAKFLGLPVGSQGEMFEDLPESERLSKLWYARGVTAAKAGQIAQPPAETPVECLKDFVSGWESVKGGDKAPKATKAEKEPKSATKTEKASKAKLEAEAKANGGTGGPKAPPVDADMEKAFDKADEVAALNGGDHGGGKQQDEELDPAFQ